MNPFEVTTCIRAMGSCRTVRLSHVNCEEWKSMEMAHIYPTVDSVLIVMTLLVYGGLVHVDI